MSLHRIVLLVSLVSLTSTSLLPAGNAAATATPAPTEYDRKGSSSNGAVAQSADVVEFDTNKRLLTTPPSNAALQESYAKAEQAPNASYALVALCQPYARHNPDIFALRVFEKFLEISRQKNWFRTYTISTGEDQLLIGEQFPKILTADLNSTQSNSIALQLHPIFWCCMGIAYAYSRRIALLGGFSKFDLADLTEIAMRRSIPPARCDFMFHYQSPPYHSVERAHKKYWDAIKSTPIIETTLIDQAHMPRVIAELIRHYCLDTQFGNSVEEFLEEPSAFMSSLPCSNSYLISSLAGLAGFPRCIGTCDLRNNIISKVTPTDLRSSTVKNLNLSNNRIATLPPRVFPGLQVLHLHNNWITQLTREMFAECHALRELEFDGNPLTTIEEGTFAQLPHLRRVSMCRTQLPLLPPDFTVMANRSDVADALSLLELYGNPFLKKPDEKAKYDALKRKVAANSYKYNQALVKEARDHVLAPSADSESAGTD